MYRRNETKRKGTQGLKDSRTQGCRDGQLFDCTCRSSDTCNEYVETEVNRVNLYRFSGSRAISNSLDGKGLGGGERGEGGSRRHQTTDMSWENLALSMNRTEIRKYYPSNNISIYLVSCVCVCVCVFIL